MRGVGGEGVSAACWAFRVYTRKELAGSKMSQLRLLYPQVLCLGVPKEQLPARVVIMVMKERRPPWVLGTRDLRGGFGLPRKSLGLISSSSQAPLWGLRVYTQVTRSW